MMVIQLCRNLSKKNGVIIMIGSEESEKVDGRLHVTSRFARWQVDVGVAGDASAHHVLLQVC